jgi:hypothetical protein
MKSYYDAYQAYEHRVMRGEFDSAPKPTGMKLTGREPLLAWVGDLLINAGLKLKRRYATGKSMAWSPLSGSKP